jgi:hypothetical protein
MLSKLANWLGIQEADGQQSLARLTLVLFICFALVYALSPQGRPPYSDLQKGAEITRVATTVAIEGSFAHPFYALPTGPTAHVAPGYVLVNALVMKLFGFGWTGAMVLWTLNVAFLALQLALLPQLSKRLGLGIYPGIMAAILGAAVQPYRVLPEWESLFAGALLVTLCVLTIPYFQAPKDWRRSFLLGLVWGFAILTNPESILLLFAWAHIAAMRNSPVLLSRARQAMLVVLAGAALACLPWFIRNWQEFHAVFFIRDNLGIELSVSNNSCARPTLLENIISGCHQKTHPNSNVQIAEEVMDQGEVRFNQQRLRQAISWISSHPREFLWLTAQRFRRFWFPFLGSYRYALPMGLLTILSLAGLIWMFQEDRLAALLFLSTLVIYPLIHYVVQFEARYRYPIFWATLLPAAYALEKLIRRRKVAEDSLQNSSQPESEFAALQN